MISLKERMKASGYTFVFFAGFGLLMDALPFILNGHFFLLWLPAFIAGWLVLLISSLIVYYFDLKKLRKEKPQ